MTLPEQLESAEAGSRELDALVQNLENRVPSRWIAFLASVGVWFLFGGLAQLLGVNGFNDHFQEIVLRLGLVAAFVTWWEIRRFKYTAAAIQARGDG